MASATYIVEIDFGRDGTYGHADADITSYVRDMSWSNGMSQPDMNFARPATLNLTLINDDGAWNIEDSGATFNGLLRMGLLVRVRATFGNTYTLFIGKIDSLPNSDIRTYGTKQVSLVVRDLMLELLDAEFIPALLTDVRTDEALQHAFDRAIFVLPYIGNYWVLEASTSVLGTNTFLADIGNVTDFETGQTTLEYIGDNTGEGRTQRAQTFLRDVVDAELGGRFFYNTRTGKFTFHNRHNNINQSIDATFTKSDFKDPRYVVQTDVINRVTVHYNPREVGAPDTVLWSTDNVIALKGGEEKVFTVRYQDVNDKSANVGALNVTPPVPGLDYIGNAAEDGSGTNYTERLSISFEALGASANVTVANDGGKETVYITTLQLRGTPITSFDRRSVEVVDPDSVVSYDEHAHVVTIKALGDDDLAESYARVILRGHKEPYSVFEQIAVGANSSDALMTNTLVRAVGDGIRITDDQIDHDRDYVIVGERHQVRGGGDHTHDVTWILKPLAREVYWLLGTAGYSELDETTIPAL